MVTHNPLYGSGQAGLPHPALTSGDNAHAAQGIRMTRAGGRQPAADQAPHPVPKHAGFLAAPQKRAMPEPTYLEPKRVQRRAVGRHSVITNVSTHNRPQPLAHFRDGVMPASFEFGLHLAQLRLQPFANRLPQDREASVAPLLPTDVGESRPGESPGRPGEFRPEPPTDPDVNLSIHPARATQRRLPPSIKTRSSSGYPLTPSRRGWPAPFAPRVLPRSSLLRSSPSLASASVLSASWFCHLCAFPYHHRPGSQVPYESQDTSHAFYTPDIAWAVSRWLPYLSQSKCKTPVLMSSEGFFDASSKVSLHSSLVSIPDVIYRHAF